MRTERVIFESDGVPLVGELHLPDGDGAAPGLALSGPFTGVKEQVVGTYARRMAVPPGLDLTADAVTLRLQVKTLPGTHPTSPLTSRLLRP